MNYWFAELTNMDVTQSLWDYMEVREISTFHGSQILNDIRKHGRPVDHTLRRSSTTPEVGSPTTRYVLL